MDQRIWHTRWVNRNRGAFGSILTVDSSLSSTGSKVTTDAGLLAYRELDACPFHLLHRRSHRRLDFPERTSN